MSLYALHMETSTLLIGLLIGLFSIMPVMFAVSMGRWIDRIGVRKPMSFGMASIVLGTLLCYLVPQLGMLFFGAILIGTGVAVVQVAGQHAVGHMSDHSTRTANFGKLAVAFSISSFIGPPSAGFAIELIGYRDTFLMYCIVVSCALVLVLSGRVRLPAYIAHQASARKGTLVDLFFEKDLRAVFIVSVLLSSSWDLYTFVLPIIGTQRGFSPSTIGSILAAFASATITIRLIMPFMYQRFTEWQILRAALVIATSAYMLLPFLGPASAFMVFSFVLGLALGSAQPNLLSLLHVAAPAGRSGEALGLRVTVSNVSQAVLPLMFGAVGSAFGLWPVFWTMGALISSGIPMAHREVRKQLKQQE